MSKPCECIQENCKHRQVAKLEERRQESKLKTDPKHNKARSQNQERNIAKEYQKAGFEKSRRVPMSGAIVGLKGDISSDLFLAEAKMTRGGRLVVDPSWIQKIQQEAQDVGKQWVLHAWAAGKEDNFTKVVILNEEYFFKLIAQLKAFQDESMV